MNELTAKLMNAHQICSQAYPYFERAASIREEADARLARDKKRAKVIAVLAGILATGLLSEALKILPLAGVVSILTFAGGIAAGMTLYRTVLLAPSLAVYRQKMGEAQKQEDTGRGIMREHEEELAFLPEEYCFPRATGYLVKITEAGRAADLNQALVMLDEQLHRWKVEEANESILAQQKMQTQSLKGIRKSSAVNAAANVVNAAANISRWF